MKKKELSIKDWMKKKIPPHRVGAFARLSLKKLLNDYHWITKKAKNVDWDVEYDDRDKRVTATGYLSIPVSFVYDLGDVDSDSIVDDLELAQIRIGERAIFDANEKIEVDPLDTVDVAAARVQAFGTAPRL